MGSAFTILEKIADERIRQAMSRGEFDNIEGKGKPLKLEDDSHLPPDIRMAYKILKNADCLPPEAQLRKEIYSTRQLLAGIQDTQEKYRQMQKLNYLVMKLGMTRNMSPLLQESEAYFEKVVDRVNVSCADKKDNE